MVHLHQYADLVGVVLDTPKRDESTIVLKQVSLLRQSRVPTQAMYDRSLHVMRYE